MKETNSLHLLSPNVTTSLNDTYVKNQRVLLADGRIATITSKKEENNNEKYFAKVKPLQTNILGSIVEDGKQEAEVVLDVKDFIKGKTFKDALCEKYLEQNDSQAYNLLDDSNCNIKPIVFVGEQKAREYFKRIDHLRYVVLSNSKIEEAGNLDHLNLNMVNTLELDNNIIKDFNEVFKIISATPKLKTLSISSNFFVSFISSSNFLSSLKVFPNILELDLSKTFITEAQLNLLSECFPNLEVLIFCENEINIKNVSFKNLKKLNLSDNLIDNWKSIFCLILNLKNLKNISLRNNFLGKCESAKSTSLISLAFYVATNFKIHKNKEEGVSDRYLFDEVLLNSSFLRSDEICEDHSTEGKLAYKEKLKDSYQHIQKLNLDNNQIHGWTILLDLCFIFNELHHLRIHDNFFFPNDQQNFYTHILTSVLPELKTLNSCDISASARIQSEKYFLSLCTKNHSIIHSIQIVFGNDIEKRLFQKHGEVVPACMNLSYAGESKIENCLIEILFLPDCELAYNGKECKKRVSLNMTIKDLKILLKKLFGVPPQQQILVCQNKKLTISFELDDDESVLFSYGISDGATIAIRQKALKI